MMSLLSENIGHTFAKFRLLNSMSAFRSAKFEMDSGIRKDQRLHPIMQSLE